MLSIYQVECNVIYVLLRGHFFAVWAPDTRCPDGTSMRQRAILYYSNTLFVEFIVHCYDDMGTHTATSGWYYVNKSTGKVTSMF